MTDDPAPGLTFPAIRVALISNPPASSKYRVVLAGSLRLSMLLVPNLLWLKP